MTKLVEKSRLVEITSTLEAIAEANKMLSYHRGFPEPDLNAIGNFLRLREDFLRQLAGLLRAFEVEVKLQLPEAA